MQGNLAGVMSVMKGTPTTYNKDFQVLAQHGMRWCLPVFPLCCPGPSGSGGVHLRGSMRLLAMGWCWLRGHASIRLDALTGPLRWCWLRGHASISLNALTGHGVVLAQRACIREAQCARWPPEVAPHLLALLAPGIARA